MAIDYVCRNFVGRNCSNRLKRASLRLISSRAFSLALAVDWDKFVDSFRRKEFFGTKGGGGKIISIILKVIIILIEIRDLQLQGYGKESLLRVQGSTYTTLGRGCLLDRVFTSPWAGFIEDNGTEFNLVPIFIAGRYPRDNNFYRVDGIYRLQIIKIINLERKNVGRC